jgi:Mn2+/Fe2+ NRAMP family transporter
LGPGVITGAADDDPAGIATYSSAGARFGTGLLWLAPLTWPLMAAVQSMCARVGMVTGGGLMSALRRKLPRPVLVLAAAALFCANTFNVGADLAGMGDAAELLTRVDSRVWVVAFGAVIAWATIVAILGTTISPYLFFWQASEEVEEEKAQGRGIVERVGATRGEIRTRMLDVGVGTFFCNLTFFFIILTTALTLHRHGITQPETSAEVALALRPIAGPFATVLYAAGIVGLGALAIPTLAGSAAYALAELFDWREGIDERLSGAPGFYAVFALSIGSAVAMDFVDFSAVRALYFSAILNGLLAPFLLAGILAVASDRQIMVGQPSSRLAQTTVLVAMLAMLAAAVAMFLV